MPQPDIVSATTLHTEGFRFSAAQKVHNPFRATARRKQFDAMLQDYVQGKADLFRADGQENRRNNVGEAFWRGFNAERYIWDPEAPLYVAYKAGAALAKARQSTK
jgi:hypothetical protein